MKSLVKLIDPLLTNYILLINQPGTSKHTSIYMFPLRNILLIIYFKTVMILELITLTIKDLFIVNSFLSCLSLVLLHARNIRELSLWPPFVPVKENYGPLW